MQFRARSRSLLLTVCTLSATGACGPKTPPLVVDGYTLNPDPWVTDKRTILQRASFDLNCDANALQLKVLTVGGPGIFDDWASQVGVSGCDQRAVYIRTPSGWVANTARVDPK